jgi:mannose/cellobiose epimerase-like protein (N-acyl-D-glucosamine 2-epimerase family)
LNIWKFSDSYLINHSVGEWRHFTDRGGKTVDGTIGKPCKNAYHTGRSMIECTLRLERLLKLADAPEEG